MPSSSQKTASGAAPNYNIETGSWVGILTPEPFIRKTPANRPGFLPPSTSVILTERSELKDLRAEALRSTQYCVDPSIPLRSPRNDRCGADQKFYTLLLMISNSPNRKKKVTS